MKTDIIMHEACTLQIVREVDFLFLNNLKTLFQLHKLNSVERDGVMSV
jgi:hypothetical protein